ncbi:hypothetical protein O1611_g7915 [Lasiodiplodia mahajangana]|uniref:Uncharacterized protein n=1 Tax=Lasiodiplodia mahajangana TaxID=1108764 RepID=A0ACC2JER9_9PEZI|nr:hypothetical protein O1611_g7915 [Lasiodiplodia mahajangana]
MPISRKKAWPYTRPDPDAERGLPSTGSSAPTEPPSTVFTPSQLDVPYLEFGDALHGDPALDNFELASRGPYQINRAQSVSWGRDTWDRSEASTNAAFPRDLSQHHESNSPIINEELLTLVSPWGAFLGKSLLADILPNTGAADTMTESVEALATPGSLSQPNRPSSSGDENEPILEIEDHMLLAMYAERHEPFSALRQGGTNEPSLMTRILVGQVENYPRMLIQGSKLPPFIYPQCVLNDNLSRQCTAADGMHHCLPPPLANCAALVQLFYSRNPNNSKFVWKSIHDEQKRLYEQSHSYDIPMLLAAVQAMAIYETLLTLSVVVLMQAQDSESIGKSDAVSLAVALSEMSKNLHFRSKYYHNIYQKSNLNHECWVINESIRRTVNLFYVTRIVLVFQIGTKQPTCCAIRSTPLPSVRDLWDPEATETWAIRLNRYKSRVMRNRALTITDLLDSLGSGQSGKNALADPLIQKDLVTWCESLDDLGTLVWMACLLDRQMASSSQGDRALTCNLPSKNNTPFLLMNFPDWSKLDIIGKTILLAELTPRLGSFQNACRALSLQSNEVKSFLETYQRDQEAFDRGELFLGQWAQNEAALAYGEDIPQQQPIFISASSIEPACDFLRFLVYDEHVPAVQSWVGRYIVWPPRIDVSQPDVYGLCQQEITFPQPRPQARYFRYTGSLGNDTRAMVALAGAWRPKADGTPDVRIAFIDVPHGTIAYGPSGPKAIVGSGRYYICWPTSSLKDNIYNDFVFARNSTDTREELLDKVSQADYRARCASNNPTSFGLDDGPMAERVQTTVNPRGIFGFNMPEPHSIDNKGPFHSSYEPQGPPRDLPNPGLQGMWDNWHGQIFQFRLPRDYAVLGPLGTIITFDPIPYERYDKVGNPHGIGGTYHIVPPQESSTVMAFKISELPPDVPLRMKTTEPLVLIRNGMVLPRFVAPGVHEWSVREGHLDFYDAKGCYDVLNTEGRYNILPEVDLRSFTQSIPQEHQQGFESSGVYNNGCNNEHGAEQDIGPDNAQHNDENHEEQDDQHNAENDEEYHKKPDHEYIVISSDDEDDNYEDDVRGRGVKTTSNAPAIEEALQVTPEDPSATSRVA